MDTNLYALLGLAPGASCGEIRAAYHAMMREYHPDSGKAEADGEFAVKLNAAYHTLSDPHRRAAYDRTLRARIEQAGGHLPVRGARPVREARPVRAAQPIFGSPLAVFWLLVLSLILFSPFLYAVWWSLP